MIAARQTYSTKAFLDAIVADHGPQFINTGFIF
jgi:hypothetical protein